MREANTKDPLERALSVATALGVVAIASAVLLSCQSPELPPERAYVGDQETLEQVTLTAQGAGEVLVWDKAQNCYRKRPAADYPLETRSLGCLTCHKGQKEPHPDDLSYDLESAIGCTDCHGGVAWVSSLSDDELAPLLSEFLSTRGVAEITSADLAERLARFKRVSGDHDAVRAAAHVHAPAASTEAVWSKRKAGQGLSSGNPEIAFGAQLRDSWEWVRFVNPGDLRVASVSCGTAGCHGSASAFKGDDIVTKVHKSMMTTSPMLWGAALYNNGAYPEKTPRFGESYDPHGQQQRVLGELPEDPIARAEAQLGRGELAFLDPLPRFEVGQPSNILRIFERGQRRPLQIGLPTPGQPGGPIEEEPGRPLNRLSQRGLGTGNRTDPVWLNLQRTRLMDPTLNMLGTNDQPGDYRSSGCTACHMVYANGRDPLNDLRADCWGTQPGDAKYAKYAHHQGGYRYRHGEGEGLRVRVPGGKDASDPDSTLPVDEPGHPIRHELTVQIPSSQCVVCHMHPGTAVVQSYLGYMWWDLETDGQFLYPKEQVDPSQELSLAAYEHNPEGSTPRRIPPLPTSMKPQERARLIAEAGSEEAARDLYYRRELLGKKFGSSEFNETLQNMQLGDFKGHGFLFRAVFDRDAEGNLQRKEGRLSVREGERALRVVRGKLVRREASEWGEAIVIATAGGERTLVLPPKPTDPAARALTPEEVDAALAAEAPLLVKQLEVEGQARDVVVELAAGWALGYFKSFAEGTLTLATGGKERSLKLSADASKQLREELGRLQPGAELRLILVSEEGEERVFERARVELDIRPGDPDWEERWRLAVHLQDVHIERGMHCVDCHFLTDSHGDGKLYGELRAATAIKCQDCHGTVDALASLQTSGNAKAMNLGELKARGPEGARLSRFEWRYPAKKDRKTGEWSWKTWDPSKEKTAYRAPEAKLFQRSMLYPELEWEVPQVMHSVDPGQDELAEEGKVSYRGRSRYNALARVTKTMRKDGSWGRAPSRRWGGPAWQCDRDDLAHSPQEMECYSCHTSWVTSCFGCHLDMKANWRRPALHFEGEYPQRDAFMAAGPKGHAPFAGQHPEEYQRNWTTYSFQTLRTDFFMLGKDGDVSGGRFVPVRSACAVVVGSQNQNRENVYSQQQTISAEGFSGTAFSPHFPHTTRSQSRTCTDCHVSQAGDNNARLAQTLMLGSNAVNFIGRYCYVAEGSGGFDAVVVTEKREPQAVIGSRLHELAYPKDHAAHVARNQELGESYHHGAHQVAGVSVPVGSAEIRTVQLRGEYLYAACGTGGVRIYDVAQIDQKGFSERIVSSPVSPLGQSLSVATKDATSVRAPSTQAVDPTRNAQRLDRPQNREQQVHLSYAFLYVTDREEGLILIGAGTLLDGDPDNNFLERAVTFNPGGALKGAMDCLVAGTHVYVVCDAGLVVVDVDDPLEPKIVARSKPGELTGARAIDLQLYYAFVADSEGLKVLDVSKLIRREPVEELLVVGRYVDKKKLPEARSIYVSRGYGYLGGGPAGMVVLNLQRPREPRFELSFNAGGRIWANDVKVAATNASSYAYVAAGRDKEGSQNGLYVLQLTGNASEKDPYATGRAMGSDPKPEPRLIALYPTSEPALSVSEGVDRDRAVDEAGHQTAVFGRIGSRPFTHEELVRLLTFGGEGEQAGQPLAVPRLEQRPVSMDASERALRREEIQQKFNRAGFRELETTKDAPAVAWPSKKKKKRKRKK